MHVKMDRSFRRSLPKKQPRPPLVLGAPTQGSKPLVQTICCKTAYPQIWGNNIFRVSNNTLAPILSVLTVLLVCTHF